jgi:O-antigen/teichoic acid export membrane protein
MVKSGRFSKLFGSAGIYLATTIVNAAVPFALMPILTRHLSPAEYGIVAMFQVLIGFVGPFLGLNVHGAVHRRYYDKDPVVLPVYTGNVLLILLATATVAGVAMAALAGWIEALTSFPRAWLWAVVLTALAKFVVNLRLVVWQAEVKPAAYGAFQITQTILNLGLSVWLVVGLNMGWQGRILGITVSFGVFAVLGLLLLLGSGKVRWQFNRDYITNALRFGVPLIPHTFAVYLIAAVDQVFVTRMAGLSETGLYLVAVQVTSAIGLTVVAANNAITPWMFGLLKRGREEHEQVVGLIVVFIPFLILGTAVFALVAPYGLQIYVGEEFARASKFVVWLALGQAFNGGYVVVGNLVMYAERNGLLSGVTAVSAILNLVLNYPLILHYGAHGAAIATGLSFASKFILTFWLATHVTDMPWRSGTARVFSSVRGLFSFKS